MIDVRLESSPTDPLDVRVVIQLARHVASCCINPDQAFVEFQSESGHVKSFFELQESRPGHLFVAKLRLPARGSYVYRVVAKIIGRSLQREGLYTA